jgi:hypothetical protein
LHPSREQHIWPYFSFSPYLNLQLGRTRGTETTSRQGGGHNVLCRCRTSQHGNKRRRGEEDMPCRCRRVTHRGAARRARSRWQPSAHPSPKQQTGGTQLLESRRRQRGDGREKETGRENETGAARFGRAFRILDDAKCKVTHYKLFSVIF